MPGTVIKALHKSFHLIFPRSFQSKGCYPYFADEETGTQSNMLKSQGFSTMKSGSGACPPHPQAKCYRKK